MDRSPFQVRETAGGRPGARERARKPLARLIKAKGKKCFSCRSTDHMTLMPPPPLKATAAKPAPAGPVGQNAKSRWLQWAVAALSLLFGPQKLRG